MGKSVSELLKFRQLQGDFATDPRPGALPWTPLGAMPLFPNVGSRSTLAMNVVPHFSNRGYASDLGEQRVIAPKIQKLAFTACHMYIRYIVRLC
jgi:hypothetical protein